MHHQRAVRVKIYYPKISYDETLRNGLREFFVYFSKLRTFKASFKTSSLNEVMGRSQKRGLESETPRLRIRV